MLIVLGGLPGTGKTTIARALATRLGALHLRIDTIEHALRGGADAEVGPHGYVVAYGVAADNLRLGNRVIADCVNPVRATREAWRATAERAGARLVEVEVVCSDPQEHRHRVETRRPDIDGFRLPSWAEVTGRDYEPWDRPFLVIDTAGRSVEACVAEVLRHAAEFPPPSKMGEG
ncbi:AAA family ATPase [Azospirillum rugosum]|uniref:Kinase n=1 Tax=Azospirillum rugosum TaxID=416170 RepID=A0ABS4SG86_9PROT|nr:AAA family ATPase [Azospirillum rugosum]MBP2291581.1 putative kinase [Azospirillum rugosum]MDQ0524607.1 putative kinase [Azospirillum rugosum]